jgi:hypothetical protein
MARKVRVGRGTCPNANPLFATERAEGRDLSLSVEDRAAAWRENSKGVPSVLLDLSPGPAAESWLQPARQESAADRPHGDAEDVPSGGGPEKRNHQDTQNSEAKEAKNQEHRQGVSERGQRETG